MKTTRFAVLILVSGLAACSSRKPPPASVAVPIWQPTVLAEVHHDSKAFTQGLLIDGEVWLESTGQYGESQLREVERKTGRVRRRVQLPAEQFAEGLALHGGKLYQLTWREGVCLVYDRKSLQRSGQFAYEGEGWGLCSNGKHLFMSDGSSRIQVRDPDRFEVLRSFTVKGAGGEVSQLNELEWVGDELWANIWRSGWIVRINPEDGRVLGRIDLRALPLADDRHKEQDVLNGIAVDPESGQVWVTGKYWKSLYCIGVPPLD